MTEHYVRTIVSIDTNAAAAWAQTIRDERTRSRALLAADPESDRQFQWVSKWLVGRDQAISPGPTNPHGPEFREMNCAACHGR